MPSTSFAVRTLSCSHYSGKRRWEKKRIVTTTASALVLHFFCFVYILPLPAGRCYHQPFVVFSPLHYYSSLYTTSLSLSKPSNVPKICVPVYLRSLAFADERASQLGGIGARGLCIDGFGLAVKVRPPRKRAIEPKVSHSLK